MGIQQRIQRLLPLSESMGVAHRLVDRLFGTMIRIPKLYTDGFGDLDQLDRLVALIQDFDAQKPPKPIEVRWTGPAKRRGWFSVRSGTFDSPVPEFVLQPETRRAHVQLVLPRRTDPVETLPICLHLATTGDAGFAARTFFSVPLVRRGIGALILENPFYGLRRPKGQLFCSLRSVRDQFAMNYTTVVEARSLLAWLKQQGCGQIGVTGYSQGGVMAAFAAALSAFPVAAIPRGAGNAAKPIFIDHGLSRSINWSKLNAQLGEQRARSYFSRCLEPVTVSRFPQPADPTLAILVNARHDGFIPAQEAIDLHRHWKGSQLRWLEGGHATSVMYIQEQHRAILDAFALLRSRHS